MLQYFRDRLTAVGLRARYERILSERLLELTEAQSHQPVSEDPGEWQLVAGGQQRMTEQVRGTIRDRARKLVRENPHAANILRLLEAYVAGPGLQLTHHLRPLGGSQDDTLLKTADHVWQQFLEGNSAHYSFREHARRAWRDGECFLRGFPSSQWPLEIRFVDPERIAADPEEPESQGILTAPHDVEEPVAYHKRDLQHPTSSEWIPAEEVVHTRVGADSNEKRGVSIFAPLIDPLECYSKWIETELLARKLQSSIVLWRKVQGSPQMAEMLADRSSTSETGSGIPTAGRRERLTPGTILTTNHGTDIQFLQPNTNFGDAVPLGRMLLLSVAAGAGLPEFMLTADASNANFSSTMVAEGPAVKFFQSEQQFFAREFARVWRMVMTHAIRAGLLPSRFFDQVEVRWSFPQLVNRDRSRERLADVQLIESGVLSRSEVARRDGVDPETMRIERRREEAETNKKNYETDETPGADLA
ncbi:MAG: phage portal protein [Planctomycetaceae bacterium]|nr:phage portal protein [Planctomycetaceae bacterium]